MISFAFLNNKLLELLRIKGMKYTILFSDKIENYPYHVYDTYQAAYKQMRYLSKTEGKIVRLFFIDL